MHRKPEVVQTPEQATAVCCRYRKHYGVPLRRQSRKRDDKDKNIQSIKRDFVERTWHSRRKCPEGSRDRVEKEQEWEAGGAWHRNDDADIEQHRRQRATVTRSRRNIGCDRFVGDLHRRRPSTGSVSTSRRPETDPSFGGRMHQAGRRKAGRVRCQAEYYAVSDEKRKWYQTHLRPTIQYRKWRH